jgi:16S rRNA (uracil1498-N3)-methyltransferase
MKIRLFIDVKLADNLTITLAKQQSHYLKNVLRVAENDEVYIFNNLSGEYLARVCNVKTQSIILQIIKKNKLFYQVPDISLAFAPVKNSKTEYLCMKATELGVRTIYPLLTERTIVRKINYERVKSNIIEAAEQSDRLDLPELMQLNSLANFLNNLKDENLILADESGGGEAPLQLYRKQHNLTKPIILIGPEGGFSQKEQQMIKAYQNILPLNLGPRILRTETAIISALAIINNYYGDINLKPKFII